MRLNSELTIGLQARLVAQTIVRCSFDMKRVVRELRPELKTHSSFAARLLADPVVRREMDALMNKTERNADKFLKLMWDWLEAPNAESPLDKSATEKRLTAARILARGYVIEKKSDTPVARPLRVDGIEDGLDALTGRDKKDVM